MLTHEQKSKLLHSNYIAPHLQYFCQIWSTSDECPAHFEDMMLRFLEIGYKEQMNFHIVDDILYTIDQLSLRTEHWRLVNTGKTKYRDEPYWTSNKSNKRLTTS